MKTGPDALQAAGKGGGSCLTDKQFVCRSVMTNPHEKKQICVNSCPSWLILFCWAIAFGEAGGAVFFEFAIEGFAVEAEPFGGAGFVAGGLAQGVEDVCAFEFGQCQALRARAGQQTAHRAAGPHSFRQSSGSRTAPRAKAMARSMAFSSSRTLPGQA